MSHFRPQVIDGLWHSLCPSFEQYASRSSLHRSRAVSFTGLSCPTHSRYVRARVSRSLVTIIPSHPQSPTFWKQKHVDKPAEATEAAPSTPWSRRAEIQVQEQTHATSSIPTQKPLLDSSSNDIRKLSDAQIHTILRREANCAYYDRVQEIIEILIRERGEKPDRTHYHALISAQANLEHGSAAEVERLLQEMEETKTALDAGTCSAVLKALAVHPHYMLRCYIVKEMQSSWFSFSADDHQHISAGLLRDLQFELAWDRLNTMQAQGFTADSWLLNLFLYTLSSVHCWSEIHFLLSNALLNPEYRVPAALWSHLLHTATREQYQPLVREVWNRAVKIGYINPSSGLCTTALESCAAHGDTILAADVFRVLSERSSPLQTWHYESLLEAYIVSGDLEGTLSTIQIMLKAGFPLTSANTRSLYQCLRESSDMVADALGLISSPSIKKKGQPIPLAFVNAILEAMVQQGDLSAAIDTLHSLDRFTAETASIETFNIVLQGCTIAARKDLAMSLAFEMRQRGIVPNALTYDRLILVCLSTDNKGDFDDAWRYYDELQTVTPVHDRVEAQRWGLRRGTVKTLTRSCVQYRDERALTLLERCEQEGMDVSILRRTLEKAWEDRWGQSGSLVSE